MVRPVLLLAGLLALAACGHQVADADANHAADAPAPAAAKPKTVFDDQLKALDKAKAVEKQLQDDKEKADKAIEDAGG